MNDNNDHRHHHNNKPCWNPSEENIELFQILSKEEKMQAVRDLWKDGYTASSIYRFARISKRTFYNWIMSDTKRLQHSWAKHLGISHPDSRQLPFSPVFFFCKIHFLFSLVVLQHIPCPLAQTR